jgi:hypothetical protein
MRYHQYSRVKSSNYTLIEYDASGLPLSSGPSPMFAILFALGHRWRYDTFLGEFV